METRPELLTIDETAEFLRVSDKTVRRMIDDGRLEAVAIGRQWRIPRETLAELIRPGGTDKAKVYVLEYVGSCGDGWTSAIASVHASLIGAQQAANLPAAEWEVMPDKRLPEWRTNPEVAGGSYYYRITEAEVGNGSQD